MIRKSITLSVLALILTVVSPVSAQTLHQPHRYMDHGYMEMNQKTPQQAFYNLLRRIRLGARPLKTALEKNDVPTYSAYFINLDLSYRF